jgi:hypothetical protein
MTDLIRKVLSGNDVGTTGGHQAGILVPKDPRILDFFPVLDVSEKNPRCILTFVDDSGQRWKFSFIYYNNRFFGGTRNEFRLTGMTRWLRQTDVCEGDEVEFRREGLDAYSISYRRATYRLERRENVLQLGSGWKIISIER